MSSSSRDHLTSTGSALDKEPFDAVNPKHPPLKGINGRGKKLKPFDRKRFPWQPPGRRTVTVWEAEGDGLKSYFIEFKTGKVEQRIRVSKEALDALVDLYQDHVALDGAHVWQVVCRYVERAAEGTKADDGGGTPSTPGAEPKAQPREDPS